MFATKPDVAREISQLAAQAMVLRKARDSLKNTVQKLEQIERETLMRMIDIQTQFGKFSRKFDESERSKKLGTGQKETKVTNQTIPKNLDTTASDGSSDLVAKMKAFDASLKLNRQMIMEAKEMLERNKICKL